MVLSNVCGVVVRDLIIRQSGAFGVHLSNCRDFLVEGLTFEDQGRDGVHVNGPAAYGVIRNLRGVTHDDFIALNAWEWMGYTPTFGPIHHVLVEEVTGINRASDDYTSPFPDGTAELRLLPGTKKFADGTRLACDIRDCVFRKLTNIRTVKMYDQPNLELGRDRDFADPIGLVGNVFFSQLIYDHPGRFQIAATVEGMRIDDVQIRFHPAGTFKLVEIGPMSATCKVKPDDPATWTELFSPDRDVTVRGFDLAGVRVQDGDTLMPVSDARRRFVNVAGQQPNPDYPQSTPRGGSGNASLCDLNPHEIG
ncbi:MAG: right-handed parallel beta-helix repeat-containing protein [Lentisphaeria bacterium]